jgi:hypothetical protein
MVEAPVIDPNDIASLEQAHRDAMLDLVLAWGSLDGALGMLLSRVLGVSLEEGAEIIGRLPNSARLDKIRKILRDAAGGENAARTMKKHKQDYERHSFARNRIAHSHCVGAWTRNTEFVVFAAFEKVGDNALALDAISIQEMQRATRWGRAMTAFALKLADVPPAKS